MLNGVRAQSKPKKFLCPAQLTSAASAHTHAKLGTLILVNTPVWETVTWEQRALSNPC